MASTPHGRGLQASGATVPGRTTVRRALLSVFDKTGLADLAAALASHGIEFVSTGGTAKALRDLGHDVTDVSDITKFPEIMDGRVKTLHPLVHGGLLAIRTERTHAEAMAEHGIGGIDLLVVNLYPFADVVAAGAGEREAVENIDIGGPAMIRAAAKNHAHVAVLSDPSQYASFLEGFDGTAPLDLRKRLAQHAFSRTAAYDAAVSNWMAEAFAVDDPPHRSFSGKLVSSMRYGENPHQSAALYTTGDRGPSVANARQVQGKALSYNNLNDADAAFEAVCEFTEPACVIVKHANPCGVAIGVDAYRRALACDPVSAFGGIVALNQTLDEETAKAIAEVFTEVVIAPDADDAALEVLGSKRNLRVLLTQGVADPRRPGLVAKTIAGGLLVQDRDGASAADLDLRLVTRKEPSEREVADMRFAFTVAKHLKSNAIVYAKDGATVGIGAGQMSRVDSSRIAARKAEDAGLSLQGAIMASDAFFPFADGLQAAIDAGASAVVQPGGSKRDDEVIEAADKAGLAMVFTGRRHFRH